MTKQICAAFVLFGLSLNVLGEETFRREAHRIEIDGHTREYLLFTPRAIKGPLPVVFGLHGGFGSGDIFAETSKLHRAPGAEAFAFVYPSGYRRSWNAGICCGQAQREQIDDVKFMSALMDQLASHPQIRAHHFFVTGFSNGAMMTYRLACDLSERLRAVAPVGAGSGKKPEDCHPAKPVPLLHIHGSADEWAPLQGGMGTRVEAGLQPAIQAGIDFWRNQNACGVAQQSRFLPGASCTAYGDCNGGVEVLLCVVEGMAHQWPGDTPTPRSLRNFGTAAPDVKASKAILEFFHAYVQ